MITVPQLNADNQVLDAVDVHITHGGGMGGSSYHRISVKPLTRDEDGFYVLTFVNGETMSVNPAHVASKRNVKLIYYKSVPSGQSSNRFYRTIAYKVGDKQSSQFGHINESNLDKLEDAELGLKV